MQNTLQKMPTVQEKQAQLAQQYGTEAPGATVRTVVSHSVPAVAGAKQYQRGSVSGTMAPGGRGKSSLALVEAVSMATGRRLLHTDPLRQLRVWYHNGEETWEELLRRLGAVCQHYGISTGELQDSFCMTNPQIFPLRVADGYDRFQPDKALLVHMRAEIERNGFEVAILDPLITLHGLQESNPVLMRGVMDIFRDLAAGLDCSIEVVGHTRKPQAGIEADLSVHDARGASSITDALRAVRVLDVMTETECSKAELEEYERTDYVRISPAKRNYSRSGTAPEWIKLESAQLPNGDDVGVVTAWHWPVKDAATAAEDGKRAESVFIEASIRLIGMGRRLSDRKGMNYAPAIIAREKEAKVAKVKIWALEAAMKRLIEQNRVMAVDSGPSTRPVHELEVVG
jgi:hypothetical protein